MDKEIEVIRLETELEIAPLKAKIEQLKKEFQEETEKVLRC